MESDERRFVRSCGMQWPHQDRPGGGNSPWRIVVARRCDAAVLDGSIPLLQFIRVDRESRPLQRWRRLRSLRSKTDDQSAVSDNAATRRPFANRRTDSRRLHDLAEKVHLWNYRFRLTFTEHKLTSYTRPMRCCMLCSKFSDYPCMPVYACVNSTFGCSA